MRQPLDILSAQPLTLHPACPAAVAMKASVFSHTCPPHLLPHSLLPSFRVSLQGIRSPSLWFGSYPATLPKQRYPHRYKSQAVTLHTLLVSRAPKAKALVSNTREEERHERKWLSKCSNWHSCPMHGMVHWEHREGKGEKTEGQLPGGSVILIRRMRTIWTNGEGGEVRQQLSGRKPCPTLRKGKVKTGFGEQTRDLLTKFCLEAWTLNLNEYPFTPRRSLASGQENLGCGGGNYI